MLSLTCKEVGRPPGTPAEPRSPDFMRLRWATPASTLGRLLVLLFPIFKYKAPLWSSVIPTDLFPLA